MPLRLKSLCVMAVSARRESIGVSLKESSGAAGPPGREKKMTRFLNKKNLTRAGLLVLAALILAVGLELLMQHTLPPIYPDREMDLSSDPTLIRLASVSHPQQD